MAVIDQYDGSKDGWYSLGIGGGSYGCGQSFTGDGSQLTKASFWMDKVGSPTGNVVARLYTHSGTFGSSSIPTGSALATSDPIDASNIPSTAAGVVFTFSTPYTTESGIHYVITVEYEGGGGSDYIHAYFDNTSPSHNGNACSENTSHVWSAAASNDLWFICESGGAPPSGEYEREAPDAILTTDLTGSVSDIQDDPDDPDGNWLTTTDNNSNHYARVSFPTPSAALLDGTDKQEFRALVRKYGGTGTPDARIELWENGSLIRAGSDIPISTDTVISFTWDSSELSGDGSDVECYVYGTKSGGSPSSRASVEIGAIEWNAWIEVSGNLFYQAAAGGFGFSGLAAKLPKKKLSGTLTASGTLSRWGSFKRLLGGTLGMAGAITKKSTRSLVGMLTFSGALARTKAYFKALAGAFDFSGAVTRLPHKQLSGILTATGSLKKLTKTALTGSCTFAGNAAKKCFKGLTGALDFTGNATRKTIKMLTGAAAFTGTVAKKPLKYLTGSLNLTGSLTRKIGKALTGSLTFLGNLAKQLIGGLVQKSVGGVLTFSGALVKKSSRTLAGVLNTSGSLTRGVKKKLTGTLSASGAVLKCIAKPLSGALDFSGSTLKTTRKALAGVVNFAGDFLAYKIGGLIQKAVGGILTFNGALQTSKIGEVLSSIYQLILRRRRRT
jgi:hypothetical protein